MQTFTINLATENEAFQRSDWAAGDEVARILHELADVIQANGLTQDEPIRLRDVNGNRVGFALLHDQPTG